MSVEMNKTEQLEQVAQPLRLEQLPRVNLLPPEIEEERRFVRTRFGLAGATLAVVGLLGVGYLFTVASANQAQQELANEQATAAQLRTEQDQYAEVPKVLSEVEQAQNARATGMATDVLWAPQLDQIARALPNDVWFDNLNISVPAGNLAVQPSQDPLSSGPGIGIVSVTGTGFTHVNTAEFLDAMAAHEGYVDPLLTTSTRGEIGKKVVVNQTTSFSLTDQVLSHRYDKKAN